MQLLEHELMMQSHDQVGAIKSREWKPYERDASTQPPNICKSHQEAKATDVYICMYSWQM